MLGSNQRRLSRRFYRGLPGTATAGPSTCKNTVLTRVGLCAQPLLNRNVVRRSSYVRLALTAFALAYLDVRGRSNGRKPEGLIVKSRSPAVMYGLGVPAQEGERLGEQG